MTFMALIVAGGLGCSYFLFFFFLQLFWNGKITLQKITYRDGLIAFGLFLSCGIITYLSLLVPDKELGNRILHTFAGGFLAYGACFLAAYRSGFTFTRFQFFFLAFLFVTALGVGNEIVEFIVDQTTSIQLAYTITDTWLDLVSNLVGILGAALSLSWISFPKGKS